MDLQIEFTLADFDEADQIAYAFEDWLDTRDDCEGYEVDIKEVGEFVVTDVTWSEEADADGVHDAVRAWAAQRPAITNVRIDVYDG